MSHFAFLHPEWPEILDAAEKAESLMRSDPRAACFYARRSLELAVHWIFKHDPALRLPYQDNLSALVHEPTFRNTAGDPIQSKAKIIIRLGNLAVHSNGKIPESDATMAVRELFHFTYWLARTYARGAQPAAELTFNADNVPTLAAASPQTLEQLKNLEAQLSQKDEKLAQLLTNNSALNDELRQLRNQVAAAKQANAAQPDAHDYSEAETRDYFIDLLLKEAGWLLNQPEDREFEVSGMPNAQGKGYVDYVLWGDDGKPLAVVEAKRTKRDATVGKHQAKLYADCLEQAYGQRPVIIYTNGYEHWLWDDVVYPPRQVQGFYTKDELQRLIQRRNSHKLLKDIAIDPNIVERYYQTHAITKIGEAFEHDHDRKALLVMATGTGKTRTAIALCDVLMRAGWVKRVLFLADRKALVKQAADAFKKHLPDVTTVNLVTREGKEAEGRVYVSTYPTIMNLINETNDGLRRFTAGYFDLVIIDEAHRSIFQKYRAIFDYFDSLLVGLTATPKDEVDRNTYTLFNLENGVPTDAYPLDKGVADKFLVPPKAVSVPLKFQREGINYKDLSEDEKDRWDALEWDEEDGVPDRVDPEAVNKWLFNIDTVDKVLAHLMTHGLKVAGGDRLGKTIIFAKNHDHANFIVERFDANYPHYAGHFAQVIDFKTEYAQSLIENFGKVEGLPHIAVSVDMLDTGIDVPAVVNLVFFKLVRSKTKFWQMIGRGTRLCPDLFGPGLDKKFFQIFDFCQNLEFFSQNPETTDGALGASLGQRLFTARLELIQALDQQARVVGDGTAAEHSPDYGAACAALRGETAETLRTEIAAMNVENFIVRPKRRLVEKYREEEAWTALSGEALTELTHEVAVLPSELPAENEEAKRFDLLVLKLQLCVLCGYPGFERLRDQVQAIAGLLAEKSAIPLIKEHLSLILDLQTDEWWQDVTVTMLEQVRKRIRSLVHLIEKRQRKPIYTDFEDRLGAESTVDLGLTNTSTGFERFRAKAEHFLKEHQMHITIHKVKRNEPLTSTDLSELERMLLEAGVGTKADLARAKAEHRGLGLFIRSLVGLDREAAKQAFGEFLSDKNLTANQITFIDWIINYLTEHGVMAPELLYESPFTDINPLGPDGVFANSQVDRLVSVLADIRRRAAS